nr:hypothetical protein [Pseudodesulfovibrio sp.]
MWGSLISWVVKFGLGTIFKYAGYALAGAVLIWLWNDYQDLRGENAVQAAQIEQQAEAHRIDAAAWSRREAQYRADIVLQKQVADERRVEKEKYAAQIAKLKTIQRRPEYAHCPEVGPAVTAALDWLRPHPEGDGSEDRDCDPDSAP